MTYYGDGTHYDVLIKLAESDFARSYAGNERIHQGEMAHATELLDEQLERAKAIKRSVDDDAVFLTHQYNTISIFGARGTGKSSFLYSLLDGYRRAHQEDLAVLPVIDPTMIEEKGHVFLLVVSLINEMVSKHTRGREMEPGTDAYSRRREWDSCMKELAFGLPSLENVGKGYATDNWEDDGYIMRNGLRNVSAAFHLEQNFHRLIDLALDILGKKAFLLAFDDIDVDMKKGWPVLETLRKYLTSPKLLILLSGNYRLYSNNVRTHQWEQLNALRDFEKGEDEKYRLQVDELEGQYLLKIFKAKNRIHLQTLREMTGSGRVSVSVLTDGASTPITDVYKQRLEELGIHGKAEQDLFAKFLLGLSVRSQIQFLRNKGDITAFASRMYSCNIDIDTASQFPNMLGIVAAKYLLSDNLLKDNYLLLPTTENETRNSSLAGLNMLYASHLAREPFAVFDYMLRLAYMRNVMLPLTKDEERASLARYNSMCQDISLKNIIGLTMAFAEKKTMKDEHARIYGFSEKAKKKDITNRIDQVLDQAADPLRTIGRLPLVSLSSSSNNGSVVYYSMFVLLAAIAEILKHGDSADAIKAELKNLALLRTYTIPDKDLEVGEQEEDDTEQEEKEVEAGNLDDLAELLLKWRNDYTHVGEVPAYLLGRIMTRFYSAVKNISEENLSDQMALTTACLLNACLVEEARDHGLSKVNYNNPVTATKVLIDNMDDVAELPLPFYEWMSSCPLLAPFYPEDVASRLYDLEEWRKTAVNEKLRDVELIRASGAFRSTQVDEMLKIFKEHGFDYKTLILDCADNKRAAENLKKEKIFSSNVTNRTIGRFKTNYYALYANGEA